MGSLYQFLGLSALITFLILSVLAIRSIILTNWATEIKDNEILISRFTGICKVHWYWRNPRMVREEFGFHHWWNEQFIFTRYLMAFNGSVPIWEIRCSDFKGSTSFKICYLSEFKIIITYRDFCGNQLEEYMNKNEFEKSSYWPMVKRAAKLQINVRKRFQNILSQRTA